MIIVTGGAGFIGKHLVKRLQAEGEKVLTLDNHWRSAYVGDNDCDITDKDELGFRFARAALTDEITEVIHLAYINGTRFFYEIPYEVMRVATHGMLNVIAACDYCKIKKFTLISSSEVCRFMPVGADENIPLMIPDPYNPRYSYSVGKIMSEMLALHCSLFDKLTIVRPFNIYGPGMSEGHVIPDIIKQFEEYKDREKITIKMLGNGEETRSFCYIDDFVDGLMIARAKGVHRGIYNIGRPQETLIRHLVDTIAAIYGWASFDVQWGKAFREGDLPRRKPDISKLAALGYQPKWSLRDGLVATIQSLRKAA